MATMTNALSGTGQSYSYDPRQNDVGYDPTSTLSTMNAITSSDSPVMQQAAATANRQASRSGLMNSSLAVGAAQGAITQQAASLANSAVAANQNQQQIFNQDWQANRSMTEAERAAKAGEGLQQQQITNQNTQYDRSQTEAERAAKAGEGFTQQQISNQNQQFGQSLAEQQRAAQAQENLSQQQVSNQAGQFQQSLADQQQARADQNYQWTQEFQQKSQQFAQSIQANVRGSYTDAANNLLNNSSVNINNIASNASITKADKDKLIQQELANRNNDLAYLQSMYSGVNSWAASL